MSHVLHVSLTSSKPPSNFKWNKPERLRVPGSQKELSLGGPAIRYGENTEWVRFSVPPKVKVREVLSHGCWVESIWTRPFLPSLPGSRSTALPPMHLLMSFLGAENSTCAFPWDSVLWFSSRKLYQTQKQNVFILFPPDGPASLSVLLPSLPPWLCVSLPSICPSRLPHIRLTIIFLTFAAFPGLCLCYKSMSFLEDNAHVMVPHVAFSRSRGMDSSQRRKMKGGIRLRRESVEWERKVSIKKMNPTAFPSWQVGWVELTAVTLAGFGGTQMPRGPLSSKGVIPGLADTLTHFHLVFQRLPPSYF